MSQTATPLDAQLCFALHSATRAVIGSYRDHFDELGLTYTQYLVILVLLEDEQTSVGELCSRLMMDSASLTPVLKKLISRGLIARRRDPHDRRRRLLALTDEGRALEPALAQAQQHSGSCTGLTDDNIDRLRTSLHELVAQLQRT